MNDYLFYIFQIIIWLYVIEIIGIHTFTPFIYSIGPKLYYKVHHLPDPLNFNREKSVFEKKEGKFKFIGRRECLFTSRFFYFKIFRFGTFFPLKGTVVWRESGAEISGRVPVGSILILLGFIVLIIDDFMSFRGMEFLLFVLVFFGITFGIGIPLEKKRMKKKIEELEEILKYGGGAF